MPALFAALSTAQQSATPTLRTIEGTVVNRRGAPVSGAVVLIKDLKSLQVRSYIVQPDGKFRFPGLSSDGNYELYARLNGVSSGSKIVSLFETGRTVVVNLKLTLKPKSPAPLNPSPGNSL